jgi:hypothetical protein
MTGIEDLAALQRNGSGPARYAVAVDAKGKIVLPDPPEHDDPAGCCAWLTSVLRLAPQHPVTGAVHQGLSGPEGHVEIRRAAAPPIRFEPAGMVGSARRMVPYLQWQLQPSDGEPYGFGDGHCRRIAHVLHLLCGVYESATAEQVAGGVVGTFLQGAMPAPEDVTTYGTSAQRYEAAICLRRQIDEITGRAIGPPRYLIDERTDELVIGVGDLLDAARRHIGSSIPNGWLDAHMRALGWTRIRLDGHAIPGRGGRSGPHVRLDAYRGRLVIDDDTPETVEGEGSVTT